MILAVIGVAIGLVAAAGLTRLVASMLYAVTPLDPLTFAMVPSILAAVMFLACLIPARRAALLNPILALRHD
jgi:ABC-type antimicrobial peptide transport system permease subunit